VVQLLLLHENCILVTVLVSLALNVNVVHALVVYVAQALILIVHVGKVVSLIVDIVLDTVLALPAVSVASHAETYDVTVH